ncbi:tetratricopeptide repeat protein [Algoriphagus lutimaris]|uniref:tetratricopeptide repeat protein n=1 Tax=Algoriphagus lutimaris TaxID=613197 RepID=UPI00196A8237|nr:tetratricopeptide repeat protein [Algoriphagus lutimaris]MBN3519397.1 tetratricopeptide repeat protein [Algoriphagus lutimaris]
MKYYLMLFAGLGLSLDVYSQSTLYQTSPQYSLDHQIELFEKQFFSASLYDNTRLLNEDLSNEQKKSAELNRAMSALQVGSPDGPGLMKSYIYDHGNHPSVTSAGLYLGDHFFYKRNYTEANESYALVNPNSLGDENRADLYFKQGFGHFQMKNYGQAAPFFDQAKVLNTSVSPDAYYYSGYMAMESGDHEKAISDLHTASQDVFYSGKVPYLLAALYYNTGSYDQLISYAEPMFGRGQQLEKPEIIHLYLAEAYYAKQDYLNASSHYESYINSRKGTLSREEIYKAGISLFEIQNYPRAAEYLKNSASANDELGQASSYYLGHAYLKQENYQFASTSFAAASKADFNKQIQEDALVNYAKVNLQKGSFQAAIAALDEYLDKYPNGTHKAEMETLLSEALVNTNDYLRAIEQMDRITNKSPRIQSAYQKVAFYQAMVYFRDQRWDGAIAYLDKSLAYPVDRTIVLESHFWKGEAYSAGGELPLAINSYEQAISLGRSTSSSYLTKSLYGLGYAYFNSQKYPQAEVHFKTYTDRLRGRDNKENYDDAMLRLGDCYYVQKRFSESAAVFQQAINEGNSGIDYAYYRLAVVQNFQTRNQEALYQLDALISRYPSSLYYEDALYQKGQINMEETNYSEASRAYSDLINGKPNSPFVPYALEGRAVANFSMQNYDQTIQDYKTILDRHPNAQNAETALKGLQETLALQGRSGEFSDYLARYKGSNPSNTSVQSLEFEAAKSMYFDKNYTQASRAFESYLRNYPQSAQKADALYFLGDSYFQLGNKDQALAQFKSLENEPASPQRVRAIQRIGGIELENGNFEQAIPYLQTAAENARNKIEEAEAVQGLMVANFETKKYNQAIANADRLLTLDGIIPESTPKALLTKAKAEREMDKKVDAETTLMTLVNEYKTEQGAEGLYWLAYSFQEKGDVAQSNETIFDFSGPFVDFGYWYGRMFLLLADNYVTLGEDFQAKATLESIVEKSTNEEIKSMAQTKLQTLN